MKYRLFYLLLIFVLLFSFNASIVDAAQSPTALSPDAGTIERVSVANDGAQGNDGAYGTSVSADGRYVAFHSGATNLVGGDTNGASDVFMRDQVNGITERISVDSNGVQGNQISFGSSISADGRYVAFDSSATNLVSGDTNGACDVFVRDRMNATTERISVNGDGVQGNEGSSRPSISADGRYVAFDSEASNLVGGDTNGTSDIFVLDRVNGITERISVDSEGMEGNNESYLTSISADGRYVAFESLATNLVSGGTNYALLAFVRDRVNGITELVSISDNGVQGHLPSLGNSSISADGRYVAFVSRDNLESGDTNYALDVFVRDRVSGTTELISIVGDGVQVIAFFGWPSISADGRFVAFTSNSSNLVSGDTNDALDIFVRDRVNGTTEGISIDDSGVQGNNHSYSPSISANGRYVAFSSDATNLVSGDTNGLGDIFGRVREDYIYLPLVAK